MVDLIPIHKRDFLEVKIEIYHQTIEIITKNIFVQISSVVYSSLTRNSIGKGSSRRSIDNMRG